jgi:hypothetical protein
MRPIEKTVEYKGRMLLVSPHFEGCSNYALTIADCSGALLRTVRAAGASEDRALRLGRDMVDFELALG